MQESDDVTGNSVAKMTLCLHLGYRTAGFVITTATLMPWAAASGKLLYERAVPGGKLDGDTGW